MKTFNEIKSDIISFNSRLLSEYQEKLKQPNISEFDKNVACKVIQNCQNNLDNIDEVTTITIGSEVNSMLKFIQYAYSREHADFHNQFDQFMDKWILGEYDKDGNRKPGPAAIGYIHSIGITREDLQCLKGTIPIKMEFGNELRQRVNTILGTNIPMAGVEEKALMEYNNSIGEDKERAFVNLKEIQRASGSLRSGNNFDTLANNEEYQIAKSHVSGKSL